MNPVKVKILAEQAFISSDAPHWFEEVVNSVVEKYKIPASVVWSEMSKNPFFIKNTTYKVGHYGNQNIEKG